MPRIDEPAIVAHVKASLAGYKAPKHVLAVDSVTTRPQRQTRLQSAPCLATELAMGS